MPVTENSSDSNLVFWNQRLKQMLGYPEEMDFFKPALGDADACKVLESLVQDLENDQYGDDNICTVPLNEWIADVGLGQYPRCPVMRKFSSTSGGMCETAGPWTTPFEFANSAAAGSKQTRNRDYFVQLISGRLGFDGIEVCTHKTQSQPAIYYHKNIKNYRWTQTPNILLTYSKHDILEWNLTRAKSRLLFASQKRIDSIEIHGNIVQIYFQNLSAQYHQMNGQRVPPSINAILRQNEENVKLQDFAWTNFPDGTHVIEHASPDDDENGVSVFQPDGTKIGYFQVPSAQSNWLIYLNRYIVVVAKGFVYIYAKSGQLLYKKQCSSSVTHLFPTLSGRLLYTKGQNLKQLQLTPRKV